LLTFYCAYYFAFSLFFFSPSNILFFPVSPCRCVCLFAHF
jgi:hypothetical protein